MLLRTPLALSLVSLAACSSVATGPSEPSTANEPSTQAASLSETADGGGAGNHTGGADARDAGRNPDLGAFGSSCASGSDCESNVCFLGGKGGSCSFTCTSDTDCPPGASDSAAHCNPHGYCRY